MTGPAQGGLTEAQRDGRACLRCGSDHGAMRPIGWLDGDRFAVSGAGPLAVQVFAHDDCERRSLRQNAEAMLGAGGRAVVVPCDGLLALLDDLGALEAERARLLADLSNAAQPIVYYLGEHAPHGDVELDEARQDARVSMQRIRELLRVAKLGGAPTDPAPAREEVPC